MVVYTQTNCNTGSVSNTNVYRTDELCSTRVCDFHDEPTIQPTSLPAMAGCYVRFIWPKFRLLCSSRPDTLRVDYTETEYVAWVDGMDGHFQSCGSNGLRYAGKSLSSQATRCLII